MKLDLNGAVPVELLEDFVDECRKEQITHVVVWVTFDENDSIDTITMEPWE